MKAPFAALAAAVLAALVCGPVSAGKITADPNGPGAPAPAKPVDPLAQKITYTSTDKRLHTVLEEISEMTGVKVYCGRNADDWKVRDLPVVVCVNGLSLGKTLRSIADATHLAFTPVTVKGEKQYRIWRDGKRQRQLDDWYARDNEFESRQWDAWVKLTETDYSSIVRPAGEREVTADEFAMMQDFGRVIAALPPGSKEKVLDGGMLCVCTKSAAPRLASALREFYREKWDYDARLSEAELKARQDEAADGFDEALQADAAAANCARPRPADEVLDSSVFYAFMEYGVLHFQPDGTWAGFADIGIGFPDTDDARRFLEGDYEPSDESGPPKENYSRTLRKFDPSEPLRSGIKCKYKLQKPKDRLYSVFADSISEMAQASGYTIICEDFNSHRSQYSEDYRWYYEELDLASSLVGLAYNEHMEWYVDVESKLIVGSAESWQNQHKRLAPERIVSPLVSKANGEGVDIDDAVSVVPLRNDEYEEWVASHKDLFEWTVVERYTPFWELYLEMPEWARALAKSEQGLPLRLLDAARVKAAFDQCALLADEEGVIGREALLYYVLRSDEGLFARTDAWATRQYPQVFDDSYTGNAPLPSVWEATSALAKAFPETKPMLEIPRNPALYPKLTMKLVKYSPETEGLLPTAYRYAITIRGAGVDMRILGPQTRFPFYSYNRRAELVEEARKKLEQEKAQGKIE